MRRSRYDDTPFATRKQEQSLAGGWGSRVQRRLGHLHRTVPVSVGLHDGHKPRPGAQAVLHRGGVVANGIQVDFHPRIGVRWDEVVEFARQISFHRALDLEGTFTHFATATISSCTSG